MPHRAIIVTTVDGRIALLSRSAESLYGLTVGTAVGQFLDAALPDSYDAPTRGAIEQATLGVSVEDIAATHRPGSGESLPVRVSAYPLRDTAGAVERILLVVDSHAYRDLRIRTWVEDGPRESATWPDDEPRILEMVGVLAHEVRNPLAGVRAAVEMIGRRAGGDASVIGEVIARIDSLDALVDDLLLFSETPHPVFLPVALEPLLEEVVQSLGDRYPFDFHLAAGAVPPVRGDRALLRTVFLNLMVNAAQSGAHGGDVEIALESRPPMVIVTIADRGPGFSPDAQAALFRPFFTTKARGTGLGLPVARRLLDVHGGGLEVASGAWGARVTISLPAVA